MLDELVDRQDGVLTRQQALRCGLTPAKIETQVRSGRWRRLLPRVYAVFTGPPPRRAVLWAVLLRAGPGAVLSHESAAELVGLADRPSPVVHVTVPADRRIGRIPGAVVHLSGRADVAAHPTRLPRQTRVEETVLDLVDRARTLEVAIGWVARACGRRLSTADRLREAMGQRAKLRWRKDLRALLSDVGDGCHSVLEVRWARDVERAHGLPKGERQAVRRRPGGRWLDDVHYRRFQLRVELDGRVAHPDETRFRDMWRDNAAVVGGEAVLRYGWLDVVGDPCGCALQAAVVLRRNGWSGRLRLCSPGCRVRDREGFDRS